VKYYSGIMHPSRINIGIPYYSRGWAGVTGGTNGLWGTAPKGAGGIDGVWNDPPPSVDAGANPLWHVMNLLKNPGTATYAYLSGSPLEGPQSGITGYTRYFDDETRSVYCWNAATQTFFTYEDTVSLAHRLDYIVDRGLGGMMFWELSGDYAYDAAKAQYKVGAGMTAFADRYFKSASIKEANLPTLPAEKMDFSYDFSCQISHPNVTPSLKITNNTGAEIKGGWVIEFYLPKSGRWLATWGTGTLSIADSSHPLLTKYRIVGPDYQAIPAGGKIEISGSMKLYFAYGPRYVTLNGKASTQEKPLMPDMESSGVLTHANKQNVPYQVRVARGILHLPGDFSAGKSVSVRIVDLRGRVVYAGSFTDAHSTVDLTHLSKGLYAMQLVLPDGVYTSSFGLNDR
jgi:chitinase